MRRSSSLPNLGFHEKDPLNVNDLDNSQVSLLSEDDLLPKFLEAPLNEFNSVRFRVSKCLANPMVNRLYNAAANMPSSKELDGGDLIPYDAISSHSSEQDDSDSSEGDDCESESENQEENLDDQMSNPLSTDRDDEAAEERK